MLHDFPILMLKQFGSVIYYQRIILFLPGLYHEQ